MQLDLDGVLLDIQGNIAVLTLNDPDTLNAFSPRVLRAFAAALDHIEDDTNQVRCLVLTGAGRGFSAGANLTSVAERNESETTNSAPKKLDAGAALETTYHPIMRRLRDLHCPIVTAVNGAAAGVGMSFALMGDMVLAGRSAFFLQAFRRIGLVPDGGATWLLPRLIGMARAKELAILGERLPAETALEWGLINRVYDDAALMDEAMTLARELASGPMSLGLIRALMAESTDNNYENQLNMERQMQRQAGQSADFAEGVTAFLEKRDAKFSGR
jgi:2-(1,2-epoxy-1,2-dihydrophenyl)acetyl-CoA isomerase